MNETLLPSDVAECISALVARNKLWSNKKLQLYFISNKTAGCFAKSSKADRYKKIFTEAKNEAEKFPVCVKSVSYKIFNTEYAGHAKELTQAVIAEFIAENEPDTECVLVTAGGDGTSLEVQTALFKEAQSEEKKRNVILNNITILRLPLGTGNDGTDGHKIEDTIELLKSSLVFTNSRALKVYAEGNPTAEQIKNSGKDIKKYAPDSTPSPWYAFNIASLGLDAYVVYLTNSIKKKFPGNLYQLCVPLSGLVYDKDFPLGNAKFELFDENDKKIDEFEGPFTLFAFGVSGHRLYGGGHNILPTNDNVNLVPKVTLSTLIKVNHMFIDGSFIKTNVSKLYSANKVRISYDKPVLLQCDGETVLLYKESFPVVFEKTEPCLRTLKSLE